MPKFMNQKCVYCLRFFKSLTKDHILSVSWYPKDTTPGIEKWTVPACDNCNKRFGKIEEDLFWRLGLTVEINDLAASGIGNKTVQLISLEAATDSQSYLRKTSALMKMIREIKSCPGNHESILKHSSHRHRLNDGKAIRIPQEELSLFIEKMARGLEYKLRGKLVETGRKIIIYRPMQNNLDDDVLFKKFEKRISSCLQTASCGDGFKIYFGVNPYNEGNVIYKILIWGRIELWAQIVPDNMMKVPKWRLLSAIRNLLRDRFQPCSYASLAVA